MKGQTNQATSDMKWQPVTASGYGGYKWLSVTMNQNTVRIQVATSEVITHQTKFLKKTLSYGNY